MSSPLSPMNEVTVASSFGVDNTTLGPQFRARTIVESERYKIMDRKQSYYSCTQHDWKTFDFDGRSIPAGNPLLGQPNLSSEPVPWYVPLRMRRPAAPYRLSRVIVDGFTNLVFGYQRWPTIRSPGDEETESFVRALVDEAQLRTLLIRARTLGGSTGSVGISWRFWQGKPLVQVHNPKHMYVHAWADRERMIPAHVIELYRFPRDEWDAKKQRFIRNWYWFRRDWTTEGDIAFKEQQFNPTVDPNWEIDEERTYLHHDGFAHFVWIQNVPNENSEEFDGVADYDGLYETFDSLDLLHSTLVRGTTLNLDPTLVLRLDPDIINRTGGLSKGSDNSLVVGKDGDARYMELAGTSVQVGTQLFSKMRESALEVAQCVVPDPNQIGASGTSSVALKVVYAPMLGKADILREQYERGLRDLLVQMLESARRLYNDVSIGIDENGQEFESRTVLDLPPRLRRVDVVDPTTGIPTNEKKDEYVEQRPGKSNVLTFDWGDYFLPTAQDQQQTATTLATLVGGKLLSQESGADLASRALRIDPRSDWDRIRREKKEAEAAQAAMLGGDAFTPMPNAPSESEGEEKQGGSTGGMGGRVSGRYELPDDALPREPKTDIPLDKDATSTITVNEARAAMGLEPLASDDGNLTLAEFHARARATEKIALEHAKAEIASEKNGDA